MKVLVTGATGFLGKYIIEEFVQHDYEIYAFGRNQQIGERLEQTYEKTTFIQGDFTDLSSVTRAVKGMDAVIHAGALSTVWGKWETFEAINVQGTDNICQACKTHGVTRLIYISTPSLYTEKRDRFDIKEEEFNPNNELNYYIKSKILSEQRIKYYPELNTTIIRPRGLFGVGDTSLIPRILEVNKKIGVPLFNEGKNIVDITCVENVAYAIRLCLEQDAAKGKTYNLTNGEPREFKQILEQLFEEIGQEPKYLKLNFGLVYGIAGFLEKVYSTLRIHKEPVLTKYTVATLGYSQTLNIEKIKEDVGYEPILTLDEGIAKYANEH